DGAADGVVVCDVDPGDERRAAFLADLPGDLVGAVEVLVEYSDLRAIACEAPADGAADRPAATRDDDALAVQSTHDGLRIRSANKDRTWACASRDGKRGLPSPRGRGSPASRAPSRRRRRDPSCAASC